jgi:putative transposase
VIRTHKIKLYPTKKQQLLLVKSCGVARFAYNWALDQWNRKREMGERASAYTLIKELTQIKREQFPWMLEVSKTCPQYAIHNLESAFKSFFNKNTRYPRFKKKGDRDSFVAVENKESFNQSNYRIHIPKIGKIKCAENLRFKGKVNNVVVSRVADMWFASINVELFEDALAKSESQAIVGVDLGIKTMITLSDGTTFENPKALSSSLARVKRLQRCLSKKGKGSENAKKAKIKLARRLYRVRCIRSHQIHLATKFISLNYGKVVVEDLNVAGMVKNRSLAMRVSDVSFGTILNAIRYKCQAAGIEVVIADRFFASSKKCSRCGSVKERLKLSERVFTCDCGLSIDRDLNAALNLSKYQPTPKSGGSKACGEGSSLVHPDSPSLNQELDFTSKDLNREQLEPPSPPQ